MPAKTDFNPDQWDGDPDELPESMDKWSPDDFERTFSSKQEAFWSGFTRGQTNAQQAPADDAMFASGLEVPHAYSKRCSRCSPAPPPKPDGHQSDRDTACPAGVMAMALLCKSVRRRRWWRLRAIPMWIGTSRRVKESRW